MDKALLEKAAQCKSAEEVKALAAEAGMDLTEEQAAELYAKVNGATPLTDEELETVAGGCGRSVSDDDIIACDQCSNSVRGGDAIKKTGILNLNIEHYGESFDFFFCCDACFDTFKNTHHEYSFC